MGVPFTLLQAAPFLVGLLVLFRPRRPGRAQLASAALGRYHQPAGRWRLAGLTVGLVAGGYLMFGMSTWLAGTIFGGCVLAGVLIGELRVPRPDGAVRTAMLTPRRVRDYLPRRYGPLLGTLVLTLTALLTAIVAATDHVAGTHGFMQVTCPSGTTFLFSRQEIRSAILGALVQVIGGAGMCLLVVRKIVTRPAFPTHPAQDTVDNALRTSSAEAVTLAWGCVVAASLLASASLASAYLEPLTSAGCDIHELTPAKIVAYLVAAGSTAALMYLLVRLTRLPRPRRTTS